MDTPSAALPAATGEAVRQRHAAMPSIDEVRERRAEELFLQSQCANWKSTDRWFAWLMIFQWLAAIVLALTLTPRTWAGAQSSIHNHVWLAIFLGGAITSFPVWLVWRHSGTRLTRYTVAASQMLMSSLLIHITGGRIETHFHIFGSLAFLAFYRDWRVLIPATVVVLVDHLFRGIYMPQSIFGEASGSYWRALEHAGWVVFEDIFLFAACVRSVREMREIAGHRAGLEVTNSVVEAEVVERTAQKLESEERFLSMAATIPGMVCQLVLPPGGAVRFSFVSEGSREVCNYEPEQLLGNPNLFLDLLSIADREAFVASLAASAESMEPWKWEGCLTMLLSREEKWLRGLGRPERMANGNYRWNGLLIDISESKAMERMKNEFISTVSHELRTPLTSIRGSLGLIMGGVTGDLPATAHSMIEIAHKNSERLVRLINDILDIEKIESGRMVLDLKPIVLGPFMETVLDANRAYGETLGVSFNVVDGTHSDSTMVIADSDRLMQIFANLLSNAAKYSPRDEEVTLKVMEHGKTIRFEVTDKGSGIPEEFRGRIFQKFSQADSSDTRRKGGTGLGLSISKALVEQMDGAIGFETEPGIGTTFWFELPRYVPVDLADLPAMMQETWHREDPAPGAARARPRVLICEDDPDIATLLSMMLEQDGFETSTAHDAPAARKLLAQNHYDGMTLDLMIPGQDGVSFFRELRSAAATRDLPIAVVSAQAEEGRRQLNGHAIGVTDWLSKPVDRMRLLLAVEQFTAPRPESRCRILHVEDEGDLRQIVASILQEVADLESAVSVRDAQEKLSHHHYDAIILDVSLPDGSGLQLLPYLRVHAPGIPVVIFSDSDVARDAAGHISAALVKSKTSNDELLSTIGSLLRPKAEEEAQAVSGRTDKAKS